MLTKCVCPNCGHSYLADDDLGDMSCPRCEVLNEGLSTGHESQGGPSGGLTADESFDVTDREITDPAGDALTRFDPRRPPPMFLTRDRLARGLIFGMLTTLFGGVVFGAALSAVSVTIPGVAMLVLALLGGAACRSGFGGRAASRSKVRALAASVLIAALGMAGLFLGSWGIDRFTGTRADQTHIDLRRGQRELFSQMGNTEDAGLEVVLEQRINEVERLNALSDAEIEDYLWVQEAQLWPPILAYSKLKATRGPVVRLGPDSEPVSLPMAATLAILVVEFVLAGIVVSRAVAPR
ncbi:MAG: TFIIB-type zinc ribbon-containing protein [Planctomycetota bacterium]|jgi:hypothetical protein